MDEVIRVEGLTKNFGDLRVLRGIDCTVTASEVVRMPLLMGRRWGTKVMRFGDSLRTSFWISGSWR